MHLLRSRRSGASLLALGLALALPSGARAQGAAGAAVAFDIPAQPMMAALADFTATTGIQVIAPGGGIGGTSAGVSGVLHPEAALGRLLAGTGYAYSFTGPQTVVLSTTAAAEPPAEDGSLLLGPILVTGATGAGVPGASEVVIGQEDIERLAPRNVADLFRLTPSVNVGSSIPMSQKVYVNGVEETNLAVSIDGARQNNRIFHHAGTNVIDPALLKQARVDAGVAPADAGPGALGGAIAYETIDAADLLGFEDGFGARSYNTFDFNGDVATAGLTGYGMRDGFELLGSVNVSRGNDFTDGDGNTVLGSGTNFVSGLLKGAWQSGTGHRFELGYERVNDSEDRPFRANFPASDGELRKYETLRQNVVFTYTDETPEGWLDPRVVVGYAWTELPDLYWAPNNLGYSSAKSSSLSGRIENEFAFDLGTVVAGVDAYRDEANDKEVDNYEFLYNYDVTETAQNVGLFAQARLEPFERARLGIGGRYDFHTLEGVNGESFDNSGFSGNIGGAYDITDGLTVRAAYSHVWAGPAVGENLLTNPDWDYADGVKPMKANNLTAGFSYTRGPFLFEANWFSTKIDDIRVASWDNAGETRDLTSEGYELAAGYAWADGQVRVGYTDTEVEVDGVVPESWASNYVGMPAGQAFTVDVTHSFPARGITVGGDAEFALEYDGTEATPVYGQALPSYQVVNVFAEWVPESLPTVTLRAEVRNLFDEAYASRGTYGADYNDMTPLLEPGRSFILAAIARF